MPSWEEIMEIRECNVICMVNGIGDVAPRKRLSKLKKNLNISIDDFVAFLRESRQAGIIKFDLRLVDSLRKNCPSDWEFLSGPITQQQVFH